MASTTGIYSTHQPILYCCACSPLGEIDQFQASLPLDSPGQQCSVTLFNNALPADLRHCRLCLTAKDLRPLRSLAPASHSSNLCSDSSLQTALMKPWPSSRLAWVSLLTVFLFGFDGTFAFFGNPVNQLCANWKANAYQRYLAMGIISEEGGDSRFYAVSNDFEGFTVPADQLHVPTQGEGQGQVQGQERDLPYINLTNAQVLNVKGAQASWPQDVAHEKGAFILSFNHEGGFHVEDKFLAHLSNESNELLLVSLTKPDAQVERVLIEGRRLPPSRTVFSVDNKLSSAPSNADNLASMRILLKDETTTEDCILKYFRGSKHILYIAEQQSYLQHNQVKPEHAIDGGFLLNANNDSWVRFFQLSNQHHKIYLFYGNEEKPLEMPFADFLLCPEEESAPNGLMAAGIAVPVIVVIGTIFFCMSGKKKKSGGAKGSSTGSSTGAGKPTSKTGTSGKSRTPKK